MPGRIVRVLFGAVLLTTCSTDSALAPRIPVQSEVDLSGLLRAGGQIPIPLDQVRIEFRRLSDSSLAFSDTRSIGQVSQANGTLTMRVGFTLDRSPEDFYLKVDALGGGVLYYIAQAIVTVSTSGGQTGPLTPIYVGPGANADSVVLTLASARIAPGDSTAATAVVLQGGQAVTGAPVGILSSDTTQVVSHPVGIDQAYLVAAGNATTGVTVTALLPNGVQTTAALAVGSALAATVSPNSAVNQTGVVNQLVASAPSVIVLDATDAPVPGASVTFAVASGGGAVTGGTQVTDANGIATVGGWRLGQTAGVNSLTATVAGLTPVTFSATGGPTAAGSLAKISGDAQTANAGNPLANPLVVEVRDSFNNVVPNATVQWSVTDGTIAPASGQSNAQGRAQAAWTLGLVQANPTATAAVGTVQTSFGATAIPQTPTVQLAFAGVPGIGVGLSATVNVTLTQPVANGTLAVALSSSNTGIFTISVPDTVYIPQGQNSGTKALNGVSPGTATLTGTAPGFNQGTLTVVVQNRNVSVPATLNVPYGQTASLPIQLPAPAPTGGVTFTVTSGTPANVGVVSPTVTIAAGGQTANATLSGLLPGPSTVTVSNAAFVTGTSTVTTAASLKIAQANPPVNASFGSKIDVNFTSSGVGIAAPAPGVAVTAAIGDSTCLATASPVTIPTGLVSTQLTLVYGGTANLPCSTKLKVTAPNIQPDSITVTVQPIPNLTVNANTVGSGLQTGASINLGASNHGGVTLHLSSNDANLLFAPNTNTAGTATLDVVVPPTQAIVNYVLQAKEGLPAGSTAVTVQASAPGFNTGTGTITLVRGAIDLLGVPGGTTTLTPSTALTVRTGIPNSQSTPQFLIAVQAVRAGAPGPITATVISSAPSVADLVKAGPTFSNSQTVQIAPLASSSPGDTTQGGVRLRPLASGSTVISAAVPGFLQVNSSAADTLTVVQPTITLNTTTVGSGLQTGASGNLGASNHGGVTVHLTSGSPNLLLAPNTTTVGADTLNVTVPNGQTIFNFVIQGLEGLVGADTIVISASAPGFANGSNNFVRVQGAIDMLGVPANTTTLTPSAALQVRTGIANSQTTPAFLVAVQSVRAGAAAATATVTSATPAVADLAKSGGSFLGQQTVQIAAGQSSSPSDTTTGGVRLVPRTAGTTVVSAAITGYLQTTSAGGSTVNVTQPAISLPSITVGSGLQIATSGSLGASNHGGVTVHLVSPSPNLLLAPNATTLGTANLDIAVPNGQTSFFYVLQALEGQTGTTPITLQVSAPGFKSDSGVMNLVQGAVDLIGVPANTTTLSPTNNLTARVGLANSQAAPTFLVQLQSVRFGAPGPLNARFRSSSPAVGDLVRKGPVADSVQIIPIAVGASQTVGDTGSGGVLFRPLLSGSTTVGVSIPGFLAVTSAAGSPVNITQPGITVNAQVVGAGLQSSANGSLGASNHGGVTVQLTSSNPALLLSPDNATPGSNSVSVFVPSGQTVFNYYVQGLERSDTLRRDTVTVAVTAVASGFTNGNGTVDVTPAAFDVSGLPTTATPNSADQPFTVRLGRASGNLPSSFLIALQAVRAGAPGPLTVTLRSSNTASGTLVNSLGAGSPIQVQIQPGQSATAGTVASGGAAFRPLAAGSVTVTASVPGATTTSSSAVPVTVQ